MCLKNKTLQPLVILVFISVLTMALIGLYGLTHALSFKADPALNWQAIQYGDYVLQQIMSKQYQKTPCIPAPKPSNFSSICDFHGLQDEKITAFIPIEKHFGSSNFTVSVLVTSYHEIQNQEAALISVTIKHDQLENLHFSGLKTKGLQDEKNKRLHVY